MRTAQYNFSVAVFKVCVQSLRSRFTERFEIVSGFFCWIFALQKISLLTVQGNIQGHIVKGACAYPLAGSKASKRQAEKIV